MTNEDDDDRMANAMAAIFAEIPGRLSIRAIMLDAHQRIVSAAGPSVAEDRVKSNLVEVLREIAAHAVGEFTRRTGEQFFWHDEPEWTPETGDVLMAFALDAKGNVIFGDTAPTPVFTLCPECAAAPPDARGKVLCRACLERLAEIQ